MSVVLGTVLIVLGGLSQSSQHSEIDIIIIPLKLKHREDIQLMNGRTGIST